MIRATRENGAVFVSLIILVLTLGGCANNNEYAVDEFFLRGHLHIQTDVPLVSIYSTPPSTSPVWGRENLLIRARFKFKDKEQLEKFLLAEQVKEKWNAMPVPDKIYMRLQERDRFWQSELVQIDRIKTGYWVCETTSGKGLMTAKDYFRFPPYEPDLDFLIGALDMDSMELYVVVKQDY